MLWLEFESSNLEAANCTKKQNKKNYEKFLTKYLKFGYDLKMVISYKIYYFFNFFSLKYLFIFWFFWFDFFSKKIYHYCFFRIKSYFGMSSISDFDVYFFETYIKLCKFLHQLNYFEFLVLNFKTSTAFSRKFLNHYSLLQTPHILPMHHQVLLISLHGN